MNTKRMFALFKRELKDIFRDRKTLIMMIVVPMLLYPLLIVGMSLLTSAISSSQHSEVYNIAYVNMDEAEIQLLEAIAEDEEKIDYTFQTVQSSSPEEDLQNEVIDVYVTKEMDGEQTKYQVHYLSAGNSSSVAGYAVMDILEYYREDIRKEKVLESGLDENQILYPITYELADASTNEESLGNMLGQMVPFFLITSICMGAIYPAIDVTSGEKERGTLETLLTLPVTNFEMIMSKFLAVAVIASISALLNIVSLGVAFIFMFQTLVAGNGEIQLELASFIPAILFLGLVVIFFGMLVTAVSMCTCIFAKSFKEANNYVTPVLLVFMFGGYTSMIPDLQLTTTTAAIPIINVTQMIKSLFNFEYNYPLFGIVLLSNVVYSILVVMVLAKLYNSESILFSEGFTNIKIFTKRSEMKKGSIAGVGDSLLLLCVVLLFMFYAGSFVTVKWAIYGVLIQQLFILLAPILYALYAKFDMKKMFSLRMPGIKGGIGTLFVFVGAFTLNLVISYALTFVFSDSAQNANQTFDIIYSAPFALVLFVTAVVPAIGEELLFRGFTFTSIREKCKAIPTILIVSAIFGVYHMSLIKFFTTAFLGCVLAILVEATGSIVPGMILHFLNNAIAAVISFYPEETANLFPFFAKETLNTGDIIMLLVVGAVSLAIGMVLVFMKKKKEA